MRRSGTLRRQQPHTNRCQPVRASPDCYVPTTACLHWPQPEELLLGPHYLADIVQLANRVRSRRFKRLRALGLQSKRAGQGGWGKVGKVAAADGLEEEEEEAEGGNKGLDEEDDGGGDPVGGRPAD